MNTAQTMTGDGKISECVHLSHEAEPEKIISEVTKLYPLMRGRRAVFEEELHYEIRQLDQKKLNLLLAIEEGEDEVSENLARAASYHKRRIMAIQCIFQMMYWPHPTATEDKT